MNRFLPAFWYRSSEAKLREYSAALARYPIPDDEEASLKEAQIADARFAIDSELQRRGLAPMEAADPVYRRGHEVSRDCPCDRCDAWFRAHGDDEEG